MVFFFNLANVQMTNHISGFHTHKKFVAVRDFLDSKAPETLESQPLYQLHVQSFMESYLMDYCFGAKSEWPDYQLLAEVTRMVQIISLFGSLLIIIRYVSHRIPQIWVSLSEQLC